MRQSGLASAILILLCGFSTIIDANSSAAPTWSLLSTGPTPASRGIHAMVFDEAHNQLVIFGGIRGEDVYLNDTWIWNGSTWQQRSTPVAPAARAGHAMAYDAARGEVVLFGGSDLSLGILYGDTWVWNGSQWTRKYPISSPPARTYTSMVYDSARQQLVLFGGFDGINNCYNDTWVWNGSNWSQKTSASKPVGRAGHGLAFDSARSQVVLFGGSRNFGNFDDTWTWDGTDWTQRSVTPHPSERFWSAMGYHAARGETILFGGGDDSDEFDDTWVWNGTSWAVQSPVASPSARVGATMAWDPIAQRLLLFGGGSEYAGGFSSELWSWSGGSPVVSPTISSVSPTSGVQGFSIQNFQVNGSNFSSNTTISFSGQGITIASYNSRTANQVLADITIAASAPTGARDVTVSNPGGQAATLANCFTIQPAPTGPIISTVAGTGVSGYGGDGGPATSAKLYNPRSVAVDLSGNLFIADTPNHRVRKVTPEGIISTVAGTGIQGFGGDGGAATSAMLSSPASVAVDLSGNLFIAEPQNARIRKVTPGGTITTVAGTGISGYSGDSGPAISAMLANPYSVAVDAAGNLFIADMSNSRVRKVTPEGIISTVAGSGSGGYSGDGGPATSARLYPQGVAADARGNLFIADSGNSNVRKVTSDGIIHTVAGIRAYPGGYSGDDGPATSAMLNYPINVAVDAAGNLFIADQLNRCVRKVNPSGIISTVAGTGDYGYSGDGGPAVLARISNLYDVAVDAAGNLFIADSYNNRVRKVTAWPGNMHVIFSQAIVPAYDGEFSNLSSIGLQVADDFHLTSSATLTGLTWHGRYDENGLSPASADFVIRIFAGSSGLPAGSPLLSANVSVSPVTLPHTYTMPPQFGGASINWLQYSASLPNWTLGPGTYWLSILESDPETPAWGSSQWLWADSESGTVAQNPAVATRSGDNGAWNLVPPVEADHSFALQGFLLPPMVLSQGGASSRSTSGFAEIAASGYARGVVDSGSVPYGTAVFSFSQNGIVVSEAGVPASPPTTRARLFIDYRNNVNALPGHAEAGTVDVNTGIAVVNLGSKTATVTYTLRNSGGNTISTGSGTIEAGAHFACFIDQLKNTAAPDFNLPLNFQTAIGFGSLEIASDQLLSVLALRGTVNQRGEFLITTTPVADLTKPAGNSPIYFPQFVDGGGYTTSLILLNTSATAETGQLQIMDRGGNPLIVNQVGGTADSSFNYWVAPGGIYRFQTDGFPAETSASWVRLIPDTGTSAPVGSGVFGYNPVDILVSESGIPSAVATTHARVYVDLSGGHNTGLAIANVSDTDVTINAFENNGITAAGTSQDPLEFSGHGYTAAFADQFVAGLPEGFTGVLDISAATPFAALTLRSLVNGRGDFLMTTLPVADMNEEAPSPIVFPQIVNGGGYVTQFILISGGAASTATIFLYGEDGTPSEFSSSE